MAISSNNEKATERHENMEEIDFRARLEGSENFVLKIKNVKILEIKIKK